LILALAHQEPLTLMASTSYSRVFSSSPCCCGQVRSLPPNGKREMGTWIWVWDWDWPSNAH